MSNFGDLEKRKSDRCGPDGCVMPCETALGFETHKSRDPGFVDVAMLMVETLNNTFHNSRKYHIDEHTDRSGVTTFKIFTKDEHGLSRDMVAVVTYEPTRGTVLLQRTLNPSHEQVNLAKVLAFPGVTGVVAA